MWDFMFSRWWLTVFWDVMMYSVSMSKESAAFIFRVWGGYSVCPYSSVLNMDMEDSCWNVCSDLPAWWWHIPKASNVNDGYVYWNCKNFKKFIQIPSDRKKSHESKCYTRVSFASLGYLHATKHWNVSGYCMELGSGKWIKKKLLYIVNGFLSQCETFYESTRSSCCWEFSFLRAWILSWQGNWYS